MKIDDIKIPHFSETEITPKELRELIDFHIENQPKNLFYENYGQELTLKLIWNENGFRIIKALISAWKREGKWE